MMQLGALLWVLTLIKSWFLYLTWFLQASEWVFFLNTGSGSPKNLRWSSQELVLILQKARPLNKEWKNYKKVKSDSSSKNRTWFFKVTKLVILITWVGSCNSVNQFSQRPQLDLILLRSWYGSSILWIKNGSFNSLGLQDLQRTQVDPLESLSRFFNELNKAFLLSIWIFRTYESGELEYKFLRLEILSW